MAASKRRPKGVDEPDLMAGDWSLASDGWWSIPGPEGAGLHLRIERGEDGRFVATNILLHGTRVTADMLRKVRPALAEVIANLAVQARRELGDQPIGSTGDRWTFPIADVLDNPTSDAEITLGELRSRSARALPTPTARIPLGRPDGTNAAGFYRQVAEAYRSAAAESRRPAAVLAEEAGVPVTTAHRWVREARRRGFLPPGRRGRVG